MSTSNPNHYQAPCEFTIPIKLNIPIEIEPQLVMKAPPCAHQKLPVYLEPDIYLEPEVQARQPVCLTQNGYHKQQSQASQMLQQS